MFTGINTWVSLYPIVSSTPKLLAVGGSNASVANVANIPNITSMVRPIANPFFCFFIFLFYLYSAHPRRITLFIFALFSSYKIARFEQQ
jgi:hypothetical protein